MTFATVVARSAALTIGRIESVTAEELRVAIFAETPQATALNTGFPTGFPRINAYVLIPNEGGSVVAVVRELTIQRQPPEKGMMKDASLIDLPFPARAILAVPFGTLFPDGDDDEGRSSFRLERGVPVLPSVGDPVLLPTNEQLRSIVEAPASDRLVKIGTAPFAGNAPVWVHPDKVFGRHLAILGNTGSGKSCSVAGLVRWSIEAAQAKQPGGATSSPNARFIILDPNGEYGAAFPDDKIRARRFAVGGTGEVKPLAVPGWLWNGQEWAAFTSAQGQVQRPILLRALRLLRNGGSVVGTLRAQAIKHIDGYIHQLEQLQASLPQSIQGFPANKTFGEKLAGLCDLIETHKNTLDANAETRALSATLADLIGPIQAVRSRRAWANGNGYSDFQPNDLLEVLALLKPVIAAHPDNLLDGEINEDQPVKFNVGDLPARIHDLALATGGQALANVEPLINRVQVLLGDQQLQPIIDTNGAASLAEWLNDFLGTDVADSAPLTIVDLSLVPSDVVHIAVAVIARVVFEALQRFAKGGGGALPTVLVLEEAHTFVRRESDQGVNAAAANMCREVFDRIAREGRKFGLGLVLASQRPSELSATVLAQCNSYLLHRIVNDVDQNLVKRLVPDALGQLLSELPTLPSQQAILLGWAVQTPVLVRVGDLSPRPRSADPDFWNVWTRTSQRTPNWNTLATAWESGPEPKTPPPPPQE